jgi:hypothetical protein
MRPEAARRWGLIKAQHRVEDNGPEHYQLEPARGLLQGIEALRAAA